MQILFVGSGGMVGRQTCAGVFSRKNLERFCAPHPTSFRQACNAPMPQARIVAASLHWRNRMLPVTVVSATRHQEADFFTQAALGRSLRTYAAFGVKSRVFFENRRGLGACYNEAIAEIDNEEEILVFMHDDVVLADFFWVDKLLQGFKSFDVLGLAGNRRRVARQPGWAFIDDKFTWDDRKNLSGIVGHGDGFPCALNVYGDVLQPLKLLDGVLLAVRKNTLTRTGVKFDEQFTFHFYDMDICRQFEANNVSMATVPLGAIHASGGAFGDQAWRDGYETYLRKWRD
jgi:GT2 family glycosyltransferase